MSAYNPPYEDLLTFNTSVFSTDDLDRKYLQFPIAQGAETLQAVNVNGAASFALSPTCGATQPAAATSNTQILTSAWVQSAITAALAAAPTFPVGTITAYGGNTTAPTGWLFCNGATYNNTAYPALQVVLGGAYGSSSTQFNVPNLLGRNAKGAAQTTANYISYNPAGTPSITIEGGSSTLSVGQMPTHSHEVPTTNTSSGYINMIEEQAPPPKYNVYCLNNVAWSQTYDTGNGYEHYEPFVVVQYIIKT